MLTVYGFPLSEDKIIRAETRHEAIDRMAEEAKAELREMVADARATHHVIIWALEAKIKRLRQAMNFERWKRDWRPGSAPFNALSE